MPRDLIYRERMDMQYTAFQNKLMTGFATNDKKILEEAGKLTNEAISNIRTVALLNKEAYFAKLYSDKIDIPYK